ncbi:hypothetical protein ANN_18701 [Periplaneta americana]|uniref:Uncharacterized protein n=1 Tax=Periplaneta americana TaxID=6978 RepID=A0ABQ8SPH2_PERAM|nr:hypothetical protein ANN_18701 [Periplaneta americana]
MAGLCEGGNEPPGSSKASKDGPPAWGLGEGLTTHYHKKQLVTNPSNKPRNGTDSLARPQQRNKVLRFEEKDDHIKDSFYEELEHTFDQLNRYHMKVLLGDFSAKVGWEDIFKPTIGKESLHVSSNNNGVRLVNFATSKIKYTWTSLDGMTHNQIDHIFMDKRRHTSIADIRTFRGADCNYHYLVIGELRERLSVAKRVEQQANISRFNILKLKDEETKQRYQVEISNRFAALATADEAEKE